MKKLIIVFNTTHANTIGNECRLNLMKQMVKNFEITIVTDKYNFIINKFPDCHVEYFNPKFNKFIPFKKIILWYRLANYLNTLHADFVFLFHNEATAAIWINKPVFQYIHQYGSRYNPVGFYRTTKVKVFESIYNYLSIKGFKKSIINFAISPFLVEYLQSRGVKNLFYSPHGIELDKFQNPHICEFHEVLTKKKKAGSFILAYTGWVSENRGFKLLLKGIKKLSQVDSKFVLVICGADKHFSARIQEFQVINNLHSEVINFGIIDSKMIPSILLNADLCVNFLDPEFQAFNLSPPQKLVEYMAAGKPVICNDIPTHTLYIKNEFTGVLIENNVDMFVDTVLRLASDDELRCRMSANCLNESKKYDSLIVYQEVCDQINLCS
jgi:glycosyltransferase involved in cell wall biosynthesis